MVFLLANSTRKEGITEFQLAAAASHFRDQGSLDVLPLVVSAFRFFAVLLVEDEEEEKDALGEFTKLWIRTFPQ